MNWVMVLNLAVLGYTLYSAIVYFSRRVDNRGALSTLRRSAVVRQLDAEEVAALDPLRATHKLGTSTEVRRLSGHYQRHGISANGSEAMHDTIGEADVLLPYDAMQYLREENDAEVVLGAKLAVVVRLNDFHIVEGRQRALRAQAQEQAWRTGEAGPIAAIHEDAPQVDGEVQSEEEQAEAAANEVIVVGQRMETRGEIALRQGAGLGLMAAALWLLAFLLLWGASWDIGTGLRWILAILWLAAAAAGTWRFLRPPASNAPPQRVNQVRGTLKAYAVVDGDNIDSVGLCLGDKLQLDVPAHWRESGRIPLGATVDMDVRIHDRHVIAFGQGWSLEDEARRFPHVAWGRHAVLAVIGLLGLGMVALHSDGLIRDIDLAASALRSSEVRTDTDPATLIARPPRAGDMVKLQGQGSCALVPRKVGDFGSRVALADCNQVRWGGQPLDLPEVALTPALQALHSGEFLQAHSDPTTAAIRSLMMMRATIEASGMAVIPSPLDDTTLRVSNLGEMIRTIEQACDDGLPDCSYLKERIAGRLALAREDDNGGLSLGTWAELSREMQRLASEDGDWAMVEEETVDDVRELAASGIARKIEPMLAEQTDTLVAAQRGGVILTTGSTQISGEDVGSDTLTRWQVTQRLATAASSFRISGMVMDTDAGDHGLRLVIDERPDRGVVGAALVHTFTLLLALLLPASQGAMLMLKRRQSQQRWQALRADMERRPEPGSPLLF